MKAPSAHAFPARISERDFRVFGDRSNPKARFEPSGVARIGDTDRFLIVNDKKDIPERLAVAELRGNALQLVQVFAASEEGTVLPARDLEDATASRRHPGVTYAITSFSSVDKPDKRHLLRLYFSPDGGFEDARSLPFADPRTTARAFGGEHVNVEALALTPGEDQLIVGLRHWGPSKDERRPGVALLAYDMANLTAPPKTVARADLEPILGRPEGTAALEYVPELGGYLLLTSHESGEEVGGHLWFTPSLEALNDLDTWRSLPRLPIDSKAEGVSYTKDGRILVINDLDNDRKPAAGLGPNQSTYAVIDPLAWLGRRACPPALQVAQWRQTSSPPAPQKNRGPKVADRAIDALNRPPRPRATTSKEP